MKILVKKNRQSSMKGNLKTMKLKDLEQIEPVFKIKNENELKEETRKRDLNEIMKMTYLL